MWIGPRRSAARPGTRPAAQCRPATRPALPAQFWSVRRINGVRLLTARRRARGAGLRKEMVPARGHDEKTGHLLRPSRRRRLTAQGRSISLSAECNPDRPPLHADPFEPAGRAALAGARRPEPGGSPPRRNSTEPELAEIAADATGLRLLKSVFGNSPFLARCLLRDPAFARRACLFGSRVAV